MMMVVEMILIWQLTSFSCLVTPLTWSAGKMQDLGFLVDTQAALLVALSLTHSLTTFEDEKTESNHRDI